MFDLRKYISAASSFVLAQLSSISEANESLPTLRWHTASRNMRSKSDVEANSESSETGDIVSEHVESGAATVFAVVSS
jgi:hypothetical protein